MTMKKVILPLVLSLLLTSTIFAQNSKSEALKTIDNQKEKYTTISDKIRNLAEM